MARARPAAVMSLTVPRKKTLPSSKVSVTSCPVNSRSNWRRTPSTFPANGSTTTLNGLRPAADHTMSVVSPAALAFTTSSLLLTATTSIMSGFPTDTLRMATSLSINSDLLTEVTRRVASSFTTPIARAPATGLISVAAGVSPEPSTALIIVIANIV